MFVDCRLRKIFAFLLCIIIFFVFLVPSVSAETPSVSAKAAIVMCPDTREVLYAKNATERLPMASTTKIMTALLLAEEPDLSKTVTVTKEMVTVEGSSMGLLPGDTVSYRDLLYGMLLASGNDAANTTAIVLAGSVLGFAARMNQRASELGMKNTSFVTPSGLDDENHFTTAYDMALLTSAALENKIFRAACSSKNATLTYGNPPYRRTLSNHNKLLGQYEGLIGVKTGFTKRSGRCLVTAAERDGERVVAVTLNAPNDWQDHTALLDFGFKSVTVCKPTVPDFSDTVPIISGDCDLVRIRCEPVSICLANGSDARITSKVFVPKFIYATINAGETVGKVEYYLDNRLIASSILFSEADVNLKNPNKPFWNRFFNIIKFFWKC